jgi:hypothetical protein
MGRCESVGAHRLTRSVVVTHTSQADHLRRCVDDQLAGRYERLGKPVMLDVFGWATTEPPRYVPADHGLNTPWNADGAVAAMAVVVA